MLLSVARRRTDTRQMNLRDCEGRAGMSSSKVPEYALASEIQRVGAGYTRKLAEGQRS